MSVRSFVLLTVGLAVGAGAAPRAAGEEQAGGKDGLEVALRKTAAALGSYTFQVKEGPGRGAQSVVEGKYQKGKPVYCKADGIEFYKEGDTLVYKQGEQWNRSKRGRESDPLRILGASAKVSRLRLPREELAVLAKEVRDVKAGGKEGKGTVYTAALPEAAAKRLAPSDLRGVARGGSARFWVSKDGVVAKYTITLRFKGRRGNAEVNGEGTKSVELGSIGSAKVEVPEVARKALK